MTTVRLVKTLPLVLLGALLACKGAPETKPSAVPPSVVSQDVSVAQELSDFTVTLKGKLTSAAATHVDKASYELVVEGNVVKTGDTQLNLDIPAGGTVDFSVSDTGKYVKSADELKAYSDKGGTLLTALRGKLHVRGGGTVEFAKSKEIRVPRLPKVKLNDPEGSRFSDEEVNMVFYIAVENPNPFPLGISGLNYTIWVQGKQLHEGKQGAGEKVAPSSTGVWEVQVPFNKETWGADVKKQLKTNTLAYEVKGALKGDLLEIPYEYKGDLKLNVSK